jgi:hypothetical protein
MGELQAVKTAGSLPEFASSFVVVQCLNQGSHGLVTCNAALMHLGLPRTILPG